MTDMPCLCTTLRQTAHTATAFYDSALAPSGLKVTMFRLLRHAAETPGVSITALAERLGLDRSTLGRNLRVLERQGLVALAAGEDERSRRVTVTAEGHAALETARPLWAEAQERMAARIADVEGLLATLAGLSTLVTNEGEVGNGE